MKSLLALLAALTLPGVQAEPARWRAEVRAAECAFAASMAQRRLDHFAAWLHPQALFFAPGLRQGRDAVLAGWRPYFDGPVAPFSWAPDRIEVTGDGRLGYSTGLVRDPQGRLLLRYVSVWEQVAPGRWQIVIDNGVPLSAAERERPPAADPSACTPAPD